MKKSLTVLFLLTLFSIAAFAQNIEYGKPDDLKGLTKVFIDAGTDLNNRNLIVKQIEKAKIEKLEILDSMDESDIVIFFRAGTTDGRTTATTTDVFGSKQTEIDTETLRTGTAKVYIRGKDPKKPRLVMAAELTQKGLLLDKPAEKFGKQFVKEYKKANGIK